jgi:acetyl esterase
VAKHACHAQEVRLGLTAVLLVLTPLLAAAQSAKPAVRDHLDQMAATLEPSRLIVYKKVGGRELCLHVFEPKGFKRTDRRPCFLTIHGGGWGGGGPRRQYPFAAHFAGLGLVGISIEYRLLKSASGVTVFDCVKDGRSAVRYVRSHAAELGIDPQKIIASGCSAGGHIAVGTALFDTFDEAGEANGGSPRPNALVLYYPVIDTSPDGYGSAKIGKGWRELSPLHQVRPGLPPTVIFQGTSDTVTPLRCAQAFHEAMLANSNHCELILRPGGEHGYLIRQPDLYKEALRQTEAFFAPLGLLNPGAKRNTQSIIQ